MNEKIIEELFPIAVKAFNENNYEYASMVVQFIYFQVEETKMRLSPINISSLSTLLKIDL